VHRDVTRLDELLQDAGFEPNIASGFAEALAEDQNFSRQLSAAQKRRSCPSPSQLIEAKQLNFVLGT